MYNIIGILLLTFSSSLHFESADGAPADHPELRPNQIIVEMHDSSTYQGFFTGIEAHEIPKWMEPHQGKHISPFYHVYIEGQHNQHFVVHAPLALIQPGPYHNPFLHIPLLADIRVGEHIHLSAKYFTRFDVDNPPPNVDRESRVFIATPAGIVVSAVIKHR